MPRSTGPTHSGRRTHDCRSLAAGGILTAGKEASANSSGRDGTRLDEPRREHHAPGEEPTENGNTDGSGPAADGSGGASGDGEGRVVVPLPSRHSGRCRLTGGSGGTEPGVRPPEADGVISRRRRRRPRCATSQRRSAEINDPDGSSSGSASAFRNRRGDPVTGTHMSSSRPVITRPSRHGRAAAAAGPAVRRPHGVGRGRGGRRILVVVRQADADNARPHAARSRASYRSQAARARPAERPTSTIAIASARRQLDRLLRRRSCSTEYKRRRSTARRPADVCDRLGCTGAQRDCRSAFAQRCRASPSRSSRSPSDGGRVLRTYVPIARRRRERCRSHPTRPGVRTERGDGGSSLLIAGVLEVLLLLLFVALVPVLARASSRIDAHLWELEYVATHDELTGLPNRYGFVSEWPSHALRTHDSAAIMLVDLDGFSEINSSLGSEGGDRLLIEVGSDSSTSSAPDHAQVARLGEDEFGVLISETDPLAPNGSRAHPPAFAAPFASKTFAWQSTSTSASPASPPTGRTSRPSLDALRPRSSLQRARVGAESRSTTRRTARRDMSPHRRGRAPRRARGRRALRLLPATDSIS